MIDLDLLESLAKAAEKEHLNVPNLDFCLIDVLIDEFEKAGRFQNHRSLNAIIRFAAYGAALNPQVVLELIAEVRVLRCVKVAGRVGLKISDEHLKNLGDQISSLKQKLEIAVEALQALQEQSLSLEWEHRGIAREALKKIDGEK